MKSGWQSQKPFHIPVLLSEVLHYLDVKQNGTYLDGTIGPGGHSRAILSRLSGEGTLLGFDRDEEAIRICKSSLPASSICHLICDNYQQFSTYLPKYKISALDGMLLDLGLSSHQLDNPVRGFSYRINSPLDMRFKMSSQLTAEYLVNEWNPTQLKRIFIKYGEEKFARHIVREIVHQRKKKRIQTTFELKNIITNILPPNQVTKSLSRIFQALRIAVNRELDSLAAFMDTFIDFLNPGGRIVVIAYHSLEDRLIKQKFKELEKGCTCPPDILYCQCGKTPLLKILTKKPIIPTKEEVDLNPRARSAKLRAAEKIT